MSVGHVNSPSLLSGNLIIGVHWSFFILKIKNSASEPIGSPTLNITEPKKIAKSGIDYGFVTFLIFVSNHIGEL